MTPVLAAAARNTKSAAASKGVKKMLFDIKETTDQVEQLQAKIGELREYL